MLCVEGVVVLGPMLSRMIGRVIGQRLRSVRSGQWCELASGILLDERAGLCPIRRAREHRQARNETAISKAHQSR